MNDVYALVSAFKKNYPTTVGFRLKQHSKIINLHLNPGEEVLYAFVAQMSNAFYEGLTSCVVTLTNKRILIAQKRVVFGYFFCSITPDMYNDLKIKTGFLWGEILIDTVKEKLTLCNISKRALPKIETVITEFMLKEKKKYRTTAD